MKRHKENSFTKQFYLLNSQEHNEDIRWSSSESSDYENVTSNITYGQSTLSNFKNRKRKRKVQKNVSNVSLVSLSLVKVTKDDKKVHADKSPIIDSLYLEAQQNVKKPSPISSNKVITGDVKREDKSPVLLLKRQPCRDDKKVYPDKSPIINSLYLETKQSAEKPSPILSSKLITGDVKREDKSPVLLLKRQPSTVKATIKKRLFMINDGSESHKTSAKVLTSKELKQSSNCNDKIDMKAIKSISPINNNCATNSYANRNCDSIKKHQKSENKINTNRFDEYKVLPENKVEEAIEAKPRTKIDLVQKVKSYFDSQFGSDSASPSQQSISESETLTQKSNEKSSGDLEINNSLTQNKDNSPLPVHQSSSVASHGSWDVNLIVEKSKKNKYKKDGLAYRLDQLLKKQNANISLWQHEKFLAKNSNFIIPKNENIVFRIQKINFKYGCYLLEAVDLSDDKHLIFINRYYVNNSFNLAPNVVLKLYLPYEILDLSNQCKIVINVCKFECVPIVS